jgi:hypothetical protein
VRYLSFQKKATESVVLRILHFRKYTTADIHEAFEVLTLPRVYTYWVIINFGVSLES